MTLRWESTVSCQVLLELTPSEKLLLAMKSYARKELILLHDDRTVPPGSTRLWLRVSSM